MRSCSANRSASRPAAEIAPLSAAWRQLEGLDVAILTAAVGVVGQPERVVGMMVVDERVPGRVGQSGPPADAVGMLVQVVRNDVPADRAHRGRCGAEDSGGVDRGVLVWSKAWSSQSAGAVAWRRGEVTGCDSRRKPGKPAARATSPRPHLPIRSNLTNPETWPTSTSPTTYQPPSGAPAPAQPPLIVIS